MKAFILIITMITMIILSMFGSRPVISEAKDKDIYNESWALLIGINKYKYLPAALQLRYAVNDATSMRQLLIGQFGFRQKNIITLINEQATKRGIEDEMRELADVKKIQKNDRVLIYFSGHGQTVSLPDKSEMGFLVTHDAKIDLTDPTPNPANYYGTCIGMNRLRELSSFISAKHVLFLVDACYSGLATREIPALTPTLPNYMETIISLPARQIVTAGLSGEKAFEERGHGIFTYKLLEALEHGLADQSPADKVTTATELASYLGGIVPAYSDGRQHPHFGRFDGEGEFIFQYNQRDLHVVPQADVRFETTVDSASGNAQKIESQASDAVGNSELSSLQLKLNRLPKPEPPKPEPPTMVIESPQIKIEGPQVSTPVPVPAPAPDGMTLIPAGELFWMGNLQDPKEGDNDERPRHKVYLDAFYIDKYEVTVGQYKQFVEVTGHRAPDWNKVARYSPTDQHPMVWVSWFEAQAYAEWTGKRLPTEAEWEKAARGGLVMSRYPLKDTISHDDANLQGIDGKGKDRWKYNAPVGSFMPNGYGLYDMAGNVWEWCADWYDSDYYAKSWTHNPKGPSSGKKRLLRGGSWDHPVDDLRLANRQALIPTARFPDLGFRCAKDVTP